MCTDVLEEPVRYLIRATLHNIFIVIVAADRTSIITEFMMRDLYST